MITNRIQYLSAIGFVTVGLAAVSGAASAPGGGDESSARPPVERVARELRTGAKSLIVFVSAGDKEYVATAGSGRPGADQRFRIGSVTKTFTATIVLQLVQEGTLSLSSTLENHVPGVVPRGAEITIRHLLQHRSGLANITDYPAWLHEAERSPSTSPINSLRFAASKPLAFEPGSQARYSNTNYIALGLVIEKVTGRTYAEELEHRILDPLGLERTELPATRRLSDLDDAGYNPNLPWAGGAIVSNARDLSRFYSALLSGRLLSAASLVTMKKTVAGIGLGIWPTELPCGRAWGHDGLILDYNTHVSASEDGDRVAVVSLHGWPGYPPPLGRALLCAEPPLAVGSARARSRIAFISAPGPGPGLLYVVNADGSGQGWLTLTALGGPLAWSPDGRRIAFTSVRDDNAEVYVMNADGSGQRRLTRDPAHDSVRAWSPDGRKIAFVRQRARGSDVYLVNPDGSGQRRLTRNAEPSYDVVWSPDGRKIAFLSRRDDNSEIYVMNADGSALRNLTRDPAGDSTFAWSPDGRKIAFMSKRDGTWDVHLMNVDGSGLRNLTRNPAWDGNPAWSPDGRKIAFGRDGEIYVMNADGSRQRRLTLNARDPAWSPDGRKIAFYRVGDIYVMNADGSRQRNLTRSPWNEGPAAWSPGRSR
jgi:Tol biopolymer transport system component/CubicO group peptidase (beta-lactamase class C family)